MITSHKDLKKGEKGTTMSLKRIDWKILTKW